MSTHTSILQSAKRIVVKVGSSLVTNMGQGINPEAIASWAKQIHALRLDGRHVIFVSSGAIAEGMKRLGWDKRPSEINELQAAAAVGQVGLVASYQAAFSQYKMQSAQVLLTHDDLRDRERYLNARLTLMTLLDLGVVPIINENDTVVTDEIKFGDNDTLGALVANLTEADCLVILTDQTGLYTADPRKDPHAKLVKEGIAGDPQYEAMAGGAGTQFGKGGMITKILAAKRAASSGAHTIIAPGAEPNVLVRMANGESIGTQLLAQTQLLSAKKQWMADHLQVKGWVVIDEGAEQKIQHEGKSLLSVGIIDVHGDFTRGEVILCKNQIGREIARGICNYDSAECRLLLGKNTSDIETILGRPGEPALIHRDNMVLS